MYTIELPSAAAERSKEGRRRSAAGNGEAGEGTKSAHP
jgi:hypothetical protein